MNRSHLHDWDPSPTDPTCVTGLNYRIQSAMRTVAAVWQKQISDTKPPLKSLVKNNRANLSVTAWRWLNWRTCPVIVYAHTKGIRTHSSGAFTPSEFCLVKTLKQTSGALCFCWCKSCRSDPGAKQTTRLGLHKNVGFGLRPTTGLIMLTDLCFQHHFKAVISNKSVCWSGNEPEEVL